MSSSNSVNTVSDTTPVETTPSPVNQYRTRSGRVTRQAVRYEPDPNTVFLDDEGEYDTDVDDQESIEGDSEEESAPESEDDEMTDVDSDDDIISETSSLADSGIESGDDEDVLDWDNLTDNASDRDLLESEDEFEDDVPGMTDDEGEE